MDASQRIALIESRLTEAFDPTSLEIIDDSHKHAGHAGAKHGGHFTVNIVSQAFAGQTLVQRHRLIYQALGEAMQTEIHALSIKAQSAEEISKP